MRGRGPSTFRRTMRTGRLQGATPPGQVRLSHVTGGLRPPAIHGEPRCGSEKMEKLQSTGLRHRNLLSSTPGHCALPASRFAPHLILKAELGFLTQRRKGAEDAELRSHGGPENVHPLGAPLEPRTLPHSSALSASLRLCVFHPFAVFRVILETAMECPRKARNDTKRRLCEIFLPHPVGERNNCRNRLAFRAFRVFRGPQSRI